MGVEGRGIGFGGDSAQHLRCGVVSASLGRPNIGSAVGALTESVNGEARVSWADARRQSESWAVVSYLLEGHGRAEQGQLCTGFWSAEDEECE